MASWQRLAPALLTTTAAAGALVLAQTGCVGGERCTSGSVPCTAALESAAQILAPASERPEAEPVVVTHGRVYLDLSESMRGFISDAEAGIPFSLLQETMDRILEEAFADIGLDTVERHGFGTEIHRDLPPLQSFAVQAAGGPSPRALYTEANTDLIGVVRDIAAAPQALSVVITDGVQDLRQTGQGGVVGPGFIRTALQQALVDELIEGGHGLWLLGIRGQVDTEECYFNVKPDAQGQVNRCLHVSQRPVYLWIAGRDVDLARQLVSYLTTKLRAEAAARPLGDDDQLIEVLELWPGSLPTLTLAEIRDRPPVADNILHRLELIDEPATIAACLVLERDPRGILNAAFEARLGATNGHRMATVATLPPRAWRLDLEAPEGWNVEVDPPSAGDGASRTFVLSAPYGVAVEGMVSGPLEFPVRLRLDLATGLEGHWVRRWSTDDDTTAEAVAGRTLYLEDVVVGTLETALRHHRFGRCLHLRISLR
jgi:hypothetical protein